MKPGGSGGSITNQSVFLWVRKAMFFFFILGVLLASWSSANNGWGMELVEVSQKRSTQTWDSAMTFHVSPFEARILTLAPKRCTLWIKIMEQTLRFGCPESKKIHLKYPKMAKIDLANLFLSEPTTGRSRRSKQQSRWPVTLLGKVDFCDLTTTTSPDDDGYKRRNCHTKDHIQIERDRWLI